MAFSMKNLIRRQKITAAREAKAAEKAETKRSQRGGDGGTVQRNGNVADSAKRARNKKMVTYFVQALISELPRDVLGLKWKLRKICRWNDELQRDCNDSFAMVLAVLNESSRTQFESYDEQVLEAKRNEIGDLMRGLSRR